MCLLRWAYCRGDSRLPAECRGNTGEADDAEPESLDSGPQVLLNLLCVDGLGSSAFEPLFRHVMVSSLAKDGRNPSAGGRW